MLAWLWHALGFDYGLPYGHVGWYNVWSGFGSDVGEVAILGGLYQMYRKHACHEPRCWRISRHLVNGSPWCNKHHGGARDAHAAAQQPATAPVPASEAALVKLSGDISGLAEAIRASLATRKTTRGSQS